jgi:hypothetical protein
MFVWGGGGGVLLAGAKQLLGFGCAVPDSRFLTVYKGGVRLEGRYIINIVDVCFNLCVVVIAGWRVKWNILWHHELRNPLTSHH